MSDIVLFLVTMGAMSYLVISIMCLDSSEYGLDCLNPMHNRWKYGLLNWFGVIVVTLLFHIILAPYVPFYWFYKLMTVKKKG